MEPQTDANVPTGEENKMYELNKAAFGSFLAQLRREKGMTQKELAELLIVYILSLFEAIVIPAKKYE